MVRWPWVSRLAFDVVVGERDRLVETNARLVDHLARMDRVRHGRPENAPVVRKEDPMPDELVRMIDGFGPDAQPRLRKEAHEAYHKYRSWDPVLKSYREALGDE